MFGMPAYIHSDRGSAFMSAEFKRYLLDKGIASSRTTSYSTTLPEMDKSNIVANYQTWIENA